MGAKTCFLWISLFAPLHVAAQQKVQLPTRDRFLPDQPSVVYTIGKADGADWELLSGVLALAFDARDHLYVLDSNNYRVLVFDNAGKFVRRIGQRGAGPGELMAPTGLTVMVDGTLVVSDGGRHAYSLFARDGTFRKNVPYGEGEDVGSRVTLAATAGYFMEGVHAHPRGGIVAQISTSRLTESVRSGASPRGGKVLVKWIDLMTVTGTSTTLYEFTLPAVVPKAAEGGRPGLVTMVATNWTPANTIAVLPNGGVALAHEAEYRVKMVNPAGVVERTLERPIAPRRGTPKDKEAFIKRYGEAIAQSGIGRGRRGGGSAARGRPSPDEIDQMVKNADWRDVIPVLRRLTADPQGRIWVARTPADFGRTGPVDLLRADGAYIGTIANASLPAAISKTSLAAYIERDELGVERVTVRRLPASWR